MATRQIRILLLRHLLPQPHFLNHYPEILFLCKRSVWSMKKDPALESALSRNRRWIVNNQIKNILLRCPDQIATVRSLQKKFKTLDLQGRALNWLRKYPCCFEIFTDDHGETLFRLSKRMVSLIEEEESVRESLEPVIIHRLAKLLMLSRDHKLNVVKLNELKRNFGLPDDYIVRILPKHPEMFRIVNRSGRRNSMEIELIQWNADLAVSAIEALAIQRQTEPQFPCSLPTSWIKSRQRSDEFNEGTPYVSPYTRDQVVSEKWAVGMAHELLSLTLWKKASIVKLGHFKGEFGLPERVSFLLLRHPCIFYVSNRYKIYTVVLREGYCGSELVDKDPMVVVKEKFGELMQEGLYEYNRRRCMVNFEKKRKRGEIAVRVEKEKEEVIELNDAYETEERRRFYNSLFDDSLQ